MHPGLRTVLDQLEEFDPAVKERVEETLDGVPAPKPDRLLSAEPGGDSIIVNVPLGYGMMDEEAVHETAMFTTFFEAGLRELRDRDEIDIGDWFLASLRVYRDYLVGVEPSDQDRIDAGLGLDHGEDMFRLEKVGETELEGQTVDKFELRGVWFDRFTEKLDEVKEEAKDLPA